MMREISIDVIIPAYRPGKTFRELLRMLVRQSVPVRHILIINTVEKNWDDSLIRGIDKADVFHITKAEFDHAATRNMGAGLSDADYLLYMTQDAVPADEKLVEHLLGAFANPAVKAAYARQIPRNDCMITEGFVRTYNYPAKSAVRTLSDLPEHGIKTYFCSNVCAMYEAATFRKMGGFTVPAIFNEDMVYAARIMHLGFGVAYAAEARVVHSHNYSNMQQFKRNFDNGVSQAMRPEIFKGAPAAGEGRKMVKNVSKCLKDAGRYYLIPGFYWQSFVKLLGFRLGKSYRALPGGLVRRLSMNPEFFESKGFSRFQHN